MQLLTIMCTMLIAFLNLVSASPTLDGNLAFDSLAEGWVKQPAHGQPYCNPTGPGICNFGLAKTSSKDGGHYDAYVYDRDCNVIGSISNQVGAFDFDLYSQLPWVVVFNGFYVHFWYAGAFYSWSKQQCISYDDNTNGNAIWQCAFNC